MSQAAEDEFRQAITLHQAGQIDQAADLYAGLLERFPGHPKLLDLLGTAQLQRGFIEDGVSLLRQALARAPQSPDSWYNCGRGLHQLGFHAEALVCFDQAVKLRPESAVFHDYRGRALFELRKFEQASAAFGEAIARNPDEPGLYCNRGLMDMRLSRHESALDDAMRALALRPDFHDAQTLRAEALARLGRHSEALAAFGEVIAEKPSADLYRQRGDLLSVAERFSEALEDFDAALALAPRDFGILAARGAALTRLGRLEDALDDCDHAIALKPDYAPAHNLAALALIKLDRCEEALEHLDQALALDPDNAPIYHNNRGNAYLGLNRIDDAEAEFQKAMEIEPDCAEAHANTGLIHLRRGDFAAGWPLYEWRWKVQRARNIVNRFADATLRCYDRSLWTGAQDLAGKTILLHAEQGLGDIVQFARYIPLVRAKAARVIVETRRPILSLLETLAGDYTLCVLGEETPPDFDLHCPILSLPAIFKTTLETMPNAVPYLAADPAKRAAWAERLGAKTRPRIGLTWSGDPRHEDDRRRSMAAAHLAPLLAAAYEFHCLQKVIRPEDEEALRAFPDMRDHCDDLHDFSDTAALMAEMDLVISVDTSVAHVAGALGLPVWILLQWSSEWRWMLERSDSPWYPTACLFRQPSAGDWDGVIAQVIARLPLASAGRTPDRAHSDKV